MIAYAQHLHKFKCHSLSYSEVTSYDSICTRPVQTEVPQLVLQRGDEQRQPLPMTPLAELSYICKFYNTDKPSCHSLSHPCCFHVMITVAISVADNS